ncbi:hypothetical protein KP79_PYT06984 [Mizuhopecten yessoensis]|uniref:Uncharacterized protein n=1 Tax=Mizuhopecten yessoensis TaxID=6573 RepID=A0A210QWT0_MIZYE|nr:hypothetical protein KP79_PYT06984 [Mizuhopecten yessoensis]
MCCLCLFYTVIQVPCSSHYGKVFETTHDGTILYGNKSELIQRVRQGEEIRILLWEFNAKHQLFSTNQIIVNDQELCAQSVFSVDMGIFFTRQILMVCTSGYIQEQQWVIGSDMKERDVTAFVNSTWFANGNCRTPATSLQEITSALANGHDVMVLSQNNRFPLYGLYDVRTEMIAQFAWGVPRIDSVANKYTSNFDGNCVWQSRLLRFSGFIYSAKWQSGSGKHVENVTDTIGQMTWLTDSSWTLIYENSGLGEPLYGSLSDLRDYTNNGGHRLRVVFNDQAANVDSIFSHGGTVSAVFVRDLIWNIETMNDPLSQVVTIVTTAGRLQEYVYRLASSEIVSNTSTTIGVKWYVDVASWTEIFRVQNGEVDNNFPDILEDAIKSGKAFRVIYIRPSGNMSFAGDSVALSPTGIKSVLVNRLVDVTIESEQLVLYSPVGNHFYKFNSAGSVKIRIYDNGNPYTRSQELLLKESFSWFVSDYG